jgi:hypothetical protein
MRSRLTAAGLLAALVVSGALVAPLGATARETGATTFDSRPPVAFAWRIETGAWDGVPLDGLTVAAVVPGSSRVRLPESGAVVTVDVRASAVQRAALVSLARELSGGLITDIAAVRTSVVRFGADARYVTVSADEILLLTGRRHTTAVGSR